MNATWLAAATLVLAVAVHAAEPAGREVTVEIRVPDTSWRVVIEEIWQGDGELIVISQLTQVEGMAAMVISRISDTVKLKLPALPEKHIVLGKTWTWKNDEPYDFARGRDAIGAKLKSAQRLYQRPKTATR